MSGRCIPAPGPADAGEGQRERHRLVDDWRFQMGAIMLIALIPRIVYLFEIRSWPFFEHPILDSRTQWKWATILVNTSGLGNTEVLAKAPLYPYFLASIQWFASGESWGLLAARLAGLTMGAVTCGMTYLLGRRVFGQATGVVAGVLLALYSPGVFREGQLLDTALATLLAVGLLLALLATLEDSKAGRWFGTGLLLGLLGLARPNLLLLGALAAALLVVRLLNERRTDQMGRMLGVLALGVMLPIVPIAGRNYLISGGLVPISGTGGINLYTGNNPGSDGYSPIPSGISWERSWYQSAAATGQLGARSSDAYWRSEALRFCREEPVRVLALFVKKLYLYLNAYEIPNNVSYDWGRAHGSVLRVLPLTFALIGPLGLLGIALGGCRGGRSRAAPVLTLFVATQMVAVATFFVCGRYRMPAVPVLCVFGGFALVELAGMAAQRRWAAILWGVAGLAAFGLLVNSDAYGVRRARGANRDYYYLGQSYVVSHDRERAKEAFRQAAEDDPEDADAYWLLGQVEMATGEPEAAARAMKRALDIAPDFTSSAAMLADLHIQQGWPLAEPERLLQRALAAQPRHVRGLATLARLHVRQGRLEEARADLEQAARVFANWSRADTRWAATAGELVRAAREAEMAGVTVPAEVSAVLYR